MTYQELQENIEIGRNDLRVPSLNYLKKQSSIVASRKLGSDTNIMVFENGYAAYEVGRHKTVFPVCRCGDYVYQSSFGIVCIRKDFFDKQAWYMRLVLEGEDRLSVNEEVWKNRKCISYELFSEDWPLMEDTGATILEHIIQKETIDEILELLTEKQRLVVYRLYFRQETRKEVAEDLGITEEAVRRISNRAIRSIRKYVPDVLTGDCRNRVSAHAW